MATSSSYNYNNTFTNIANFALLLIGELEKGEVGDADDMTICLEASNDILSMWGADGVNFFQRRDGTVFLNEDQVAYTISSTSSDYICDDDDLVVTQINGDEAAAQTVLTVDSTSGMTTGDYCGVALDSGAYHWTTLTVSSSTTITIADALPSIASDNNWVYTFTTKLARPIDVISVRSRTGEWDAPTDVGLSELSRDEYDNLSSKKTSSSTSSQFYYDPKLIGGILYIWPLASSDVSAIGKMTYKRYIQDFDTVTDDADIPKEWYLPLKYRLASIIAPIYGKTEKVQYLEQKADKLYSEAKENSGDSGDLTVSVRGGCGCQ